MKRISLLFLITALVLALLSGCSSNGSVNVNGNGSASVTEGSGESGSESVRNELSADPVEVEYSKPVSDMFSDRDGKTDYDEAKAVKIALKGDSAAASDDSVIISGTTVTVTEAGTYIISGELMDGMLIVNSKEDAKLQLVFNGVSITSEGSAALYVAKADKVFVTLAEGTVNTLANGGTFTGNDDSNIDGALFSREDLTLNGSGSLTVTSPAGHGIVCKDDLVITGGSYKVASASHGLDANDSVRIGDATLEIDAGKDAVHCENTDDDDKGYVYVNCGVITAEAEGDGISAGSYIQIENGTFDILAGGGSENGTKEHSDSFGGFMGGRPRGMGPRSTQSTSSDSSGTSMKGLKADGGLLANGGTFAINSADDALYSGSSIVINGGAFSIESGDDAIHAEDTLTVTAGNIQVSESYEGLEALHIDIRGGEIKLVASDDGLNAAGGTDSSGTEGGRDGMFGRPGGQGGPGGMSGSSNGSIKISGGSLFIKASGDGIDANGTLEISGGYTTVTGPTQGDTATLDYDNTGTITGGTFIGSGSTMMAQSFSDSTQGVIALKVGSQAAGAQITLADADGNVIISHKPELDFAVVILSSPELVKGETYTVTVGSVSGEFTAE